MFVRNWMRSAGTREHAEEEARLVQRGVLVEVDGAVVVLVEHADERLRRRGREAHAAEREPLQLVRRDLPVAVLVNRAEPPAAPQR